MNMLSPKHNTGTPGLLMAEGSWEGHSSWLLHALTVTMRLDSVPNILVQKHGVSIGEIYKNVIQFLLL